MISATCCVPLCKAIPLHCASYRTRRRVPIRFNQHNLINQQKYYPMMALFRARTANPHVIDSAASGARAASATASEATSPALKIQRPCPGTDGSPTPDPLGGLPAALEGTDPGLCGLSFIARSPSTRYLQRPESENTGLGGRRFQ